MFGDALAGGGNVVRFGLPDEYRPGVDQGVVDSSEEAPDAISLAVHGTYGSSIVAFRAGTIFLTMVMDRISSASDGAPWALWSQALGSAAGLHKTPGRGVQPAVNVRPARAPHKSRR